MDRPDRRGCAGRESAFRLDLPRENVITVAAVGGWIGRISSDWVGATDPKGWPLDRSQHSTGENANAENDPCGEHLRTGDPLGIRRHLGVSLSGLAVVAGTRRRSKVAK